MTQANQTPLYFDVQIKVLLALREILAKISAV